MKFACSLIQLVVLTLVVSATSGISAQSPSADGLSRGDAVEVSYYGRWYPGVVLNVNKRGEAVVRFGFDRKKETKKFFPESIRIPGQAKNADGARTWTSKNGKFKIDAKLVSADATTVKLRKPDGKELSVPIEKLSESDRDFLRSLKASPEKQDPQKTEPEESQPQRFAKPDEAGPEGQESSLTSERSGAPAELLPLQQFEEPEWKKSHTGWPTRVSSVPGVEALEAMPMPERLKGLAEAGVSIPGDFRSSAVRAVIPVGGADGLVLAAATSSVYKPQPDDLSLSVVYWLSSVQKKVVGCLYLPDGEHVLDYSPDGERLLTFASRSEPTVEEIRNGATLSLTLWQLAPGSLDATPLMRWRVAKTPSLITSNRPEAFVLTKDVVAYVANSDTQRLRQIRLWNVPEKKLLARFVQDYTITSDKQVFRSPDRRYLFVPDNRWSTSDVIWCLDAATGEVVAHLGCGDPYAISVSPSGQKIAAVSSKKAYVWNLTGQTTEPTEFSHQMFGIPNRVEADWIGEEHLWANTRLGERRLVDIEKKRAVWQYEFEGVGLNDDKGRYLLSVADDRLVYSIVKDHQWAVGVVRLPGPGVLESTQDFDIADHYILENGSAIKLTIKSETEVERIRKNLEEKIAANGWHVDDDAEVELTVEYGQGKKRQEWLGHYRRNLDAAGSDAAGKEEKMTFSPWVGTLTIKMKDETIWDTAAWKTQYRTHDHLGQSTFRTKAALVKKIETSDLTFLDWIKIPDKIVAHKTHSGIGRTAVDSRGLVQERKKTPEEFNEEFFRNRSQK